jgi:mRNA interferase RelE/StbE
MGNYRILVKTSAVAELERIPGRDLVRIIKRISSLSEDARPHGCEKLSTLDRYRLRQGDYRIVYSVNDATQIVEIFKVGHRKDIFSLPIVRA